MEINDPLRYSIPYSAGIFNNRLQNRRLYCKKGEKLPDRPLRDGKAVSLTPGKPNL